MPRYELSLEIKRRDALNQAIEESSVIAYPSPSALCEALKDKGVTFSRQAVRNYYHLAGIALDEATGLWIKKGSSDE